MDGQSLWVRHVPSLSPEQRDGFLKCQRGVEFVFNAEQGTLLETAYPHHMVSEYWAQLLIEERLN